MSRFDNGTDFHKTLSNQIPTYNIFVILEAGDGCLCKIIKDFVFCLKVSSTLFKFLGPENYFDYATDRSVKHFHSSTTCLQHSERKSLFCDLP